MTLEAAHDHLRGVLRAAYEIDARDGSMFELLRVLIPLEDIVDHARRINLDHATLHYQAEKAGPLLRSAVRLQTATLLNLADSMGRDLNPDATDRIQSIADGLQKSIDTAVSDMWAVVRGS